MGLTVGAVIAASVAVNHGVGYESNSEHDSALGKGFQAAFWACATSMAVVGLVSLVGLKKAGKVGLKSD